MKNKNNNNQQGFTLIEVLIATIVFAITSMMFMGVFSMISNATLREENRRFAEQDARYAMEQISRELRRGWAYEIPSEGTMKYNIQDEKKATQTCTLSLEDVFSASAPTSTGNSQKIIVKSCKDGTKVNLTSDISDIQKLIFEIDEEGTNYSIAMIKMQVKRKDFDRLGKTVTVSTMVTSRMRDNELICREQYPVDDEIASNPDLSGLKTKIEALCETED